MKYSLQINNRKWCVSFYLPQNNGKFKQKQLSTGITALEFNGFTIDGSGAPRTIRIAGNVYNGNHQLLTPGAFANCDKLESVKFGDFTIARPDSVIVEEGAFVNNDILASVEFGKTTFKDYEGGMVKIYNGSFTDNAALTSVSFDKIESKKVGTFYVGVPVMENNDQLAGLTFAANNKNLVFGDGEHLQTVTFDDAQGGVIVGGGAFDFFCSDNFLYATYKILHKSKFGHV